MTDFVDQLVTVLKLDGNYSPRTIKFYKEQSALAIKCLQAIYPDATPATLTQEQLKVLVQQMREQYATSTMQDYLCALRRMCELNSNFVFRTTVIMYGQDTRPNVDWLDYDQAVQLLTIWKTPLQEIIVSLELLHGLRRCEVLRLKLSDIHDGYMTITGKGRGGGKLRTVPFHPEFRQTLKRWMAERNELKKKADNDVPNLIVYYRGGKIHPYEQMKGQAIDNNLNELGNRLGFTFSNHTLRRTFGRELFRSGVDLTIIATILGHVSTKTTMMYLGLTLDDMQSAMEKLRLKRNTNV